MVCAIQYFTTGYHALRPNEYALSIRADAIFFELSRNGHPVLPLYTTNSSSNRVLLIVLLPHIKKGDPQCEILAEGKMVLRH